MNFAFMCFQVEKKQLEKEMGKLGLEMDDKDAVSPVLYSSCRI